MITRSRLEYKYRNFMDWIHRNPITILMITFDPPNDNKYHKYECGMDEVKFHNEKGIYRKVLTFTARAKIK